MNVPEIRFSGRVAPILVATVLAACAPRTTVSTAPSSVPGVRAFNSGGQAIAFDALADRVAAADIIFFGEQHDDPETHRVELGLLDALGRTGRPVVLSLEMFERDVQGLLDDYLGDRIPESEFLAKSRPWDRYVTDYRPMVELAKARGWPVVASNVPRPMASAVGRAGLGYLDTLPPDQRRFAAADIQCPDDAYRARFLDEMRGHGNGGAAPATGDTLPTATAERLYLAQCVKDETMAEAIVEALAEAPGNAILVHYNGSFHSDYGQGTAERVRRRLPARRTVLITAVPAVEPDSVRLESHAGRADFVVVTRRILPRPATRR